MGAGLLGTFVMGRQPASETPIPVIPKSTDAVTCFRIMAQQTLGPQATAAKAIGMPGIIEISADYNPPQNKISRTQVDVDLRLRRVTAEVFDTDGNKAIAYGTSNTPEGAGGLVPGASVSEHTLNAATRVYGEAVRNLVPSCAGRVPS